MRSRYRFQGGTQITLNHSGLSISDAVTQPSSKHGLANWHVIPLLTSAGIQLCPYTLPTCKSTVSCTPVCDLPPPSHHPTNSPYVMLTCALGTRKLSFMKAESLINHRLVVRQKFNNPNLLLNLSNEASSSQAVLVCSRSCSKAVTGAQCRNLYCPQAA